MGTIGLIAVNAFRESVRDKVLYNLVFFATLLIVASYLVGQLTAGQEAKIIKDLGLAAASLFGLLIAVFIGIGLVSKEVERRSVYSVLTKPMSRTQFLLGKYAGLALTLVVNLTVMTIAIYGVLAWMEWSSPANIKAAWEAPALDPALLKAILLIAMELLLVVAVALLFSTFSSPLLAASLTLGLYIVGHFNADLRNFDAVVDAPVLAAVAKGVYYTLPNLAPFDVKAQVVHAQPVTLTYVALTSLYAVAYIGALLALASVIFAHRDFK